MNQLYKAFTMALALGVLIVGASAQAAGPKGGAGLGKGNQAKGLGGQRGQQRLMEVRNRILGQLNLTAEQKTKIEAMDKKHREAMQKLMQEPGDRESKMPKFREMQTKNREEFQAVLTPAQRTKFQELMQAEMQKMRQGRQGQGKGPAGKGKGKGQGTPPPVSA